jgi:hypothetical protein
MLATSSKSPRILNYLVDSRKKTDLTKLWSDRLLEILITNPSKLHFGQGLLHVYLERFNYDMGDMNILTLKIKEDIEFQRVMNVKVNPEEFSESGN